MNNHPQTADPQTIQNALLVTALYKVAFDRVPDAEGLAWWMNDLAQGKTFTSVAQHFAPHIPAFSWATMEQTIDQFSLNAFNREATDAVQNKWQIMAINAVPSYELVKEMALYIVGQPLDDWAYPVF